MKFAAAHRTGIRSLPLPGYSAIVAEGGGQRGIFTAGVLDAFQSHNFNPYTLAIGTSAGAQNLLSYWLGVPGYARKVIDELTTRPDFYVPYRWLIQRSIIDLDGYFKRAASEPEYQLPLSRLEPLVRRRPILIVATRRHDTEPVYLRPESHNVLTMLKASSAVPFLYRPGVKLDNMDLIDGSIGDPIPVAKAHALGARHITLIRTVPGSANHWSSRIEAVIKRRRLHPVLSHYLRQHQQRSESAMSFILEPPPDTLVSVIAPCRPLASYTFGSSSEALIHDYQLGFETGHAYLANHTPTETRGELTALWADR